MNISETRWHARAVPIFWAVTAVAFGLRLIHIILFSDPAVNPAFVVPIIDAAVHHAWAQGILAGSWPGPEPFFRAPLYPYFLAGLYAIFGPGQPLPVQIAHGLVSALGAGLAASSAFRLWGAGAAWAAGLLLAGLWSSIYFAAELLDVTLSVTLNLLLLRLLLARISGLRLLLLGVVLGLSALNRPTVLVVLPVLMWHLGRSEAWGAVLWRGPGRPGIRLPGPVWLAFGLALIISPVTVRNLVQGGEPVLIAASGGVNFYIGNNAEADGRVALLPGAPPTWQGEMSEVVVLASAESGRQLGPAAADRHFWRRGAAYWRDDPWGAVRLTVRKAWLLLAAGERSNNRNLSFWRDRSALLRWPIWPGWALVLGLAVIGLGRTDLDPHRRRLLLLLLAFYAAALVLFFINARFRLPLLAWLVVPAGGGAEIMLRACRQRIWSGVSRRVVAVAVAVAALSIVPDALTYRQAPSAEFDNWRMLGNSYLAAGDESRAVSAWEEALRVDAAAAAPQNQWSLPQVYLPLSQIHGRRGRPDQVLAVHRQWVNRLPDSVPGRMGLANQLLLRGGSAEAVDLLAGVLEVEHDNHDARLGYGWALYRTSAPSEALAAFQHVRLYSDNQSAELGVGLSFSQLGLLDRAEASLRGLLKAQPDQDLALESLAGIYARTARPELERQCWRRLLAVQPGHEQARLRLAELR